LDKGEKGVRRDEGEKGKGKGKGEREKRVDL